MCVTLNDIEYVRRNLSLLPNELQLDPLLETIESADRENFECREEVSSLLDTTVNEMESQISMIVSYIGMKVGVESMNRTWVYYSYSIVDFLFFAFTKV